MILQSILEYLYQNQKKMSYSIQRNHQILSQQGKNNASNFRKEANLNPINLNTQQHQPINPNQSNTKPYIKLQSKLDQKPLLYLMSQNFVHTDIIPENFTQKSCYERFKMLISDKRQNNQYNLHTSEPDEMILTNVIKFENQINKLQNKYRGFYQPSLTQHSNSSNKKYFNKSMKTHQDKDKKDQNAGQNVHRSFYNNLKSSSMSKKGSTDKNDTKPKVNWMIPQVDQSTIKAEQKKPINNQYFHLTNEFKRSIKDEVNELKQACYQKFVKCKKNNLQKKQVQFQFYLKNELQIKMQDIIKKQIFQYYKIKEENKKMLKILLEKQMHIEMLIKESRYKEERIGKLQVWTQPKHQKLVSKDQEQSFYDDYIKLFGKLSLKDLNFKIRQLQHVHSYQFPLATSKYLQINKMPDSSWQKDELITKIVCLQNKENELYELQKHIVKRYMQWNNNHEAQNQVQHEDILNIQSYYQMIDNVMNFDPQNQFNKEFAKSSHKIGNNISKLKKMVSTINGNNNKFNPVKELNEIQLFLGHKQAKKTKLKPSLKTQKSAKMVQYSSIQKIILDED